jgi:hypothetical protein
MLIENLKNTLMNTIHKTLALLDANPDWENRWEGFANDIINNKEKIKSEIGQVNIPQPLMLYSTVSNFKNCSHVQFFLRYLNNNVAYLKFDPEKIILSTKKSGKDLTNLDYYPDCPKVDNMPWLSQEATEFRKFFINKPDRIVQLGKGKKAQPEKYVECALIMTHFLWIRHRWTRAPSGLSSLMH